MLYKININSYFNSSKLLFSIPVHENQEIINNQIENILNYNPNSNIILHVNKSFKKFDYNLTKYKNVFINPINYNYIYGKGLLFIHISNFFEALNKKIDFEYFIIISSNEMFIKNGLILYIEKFKNGAQIVKFNPTIDWHNFHKNIEKNSDVINLLKDINLDTFYGGQTEGQFYSKDNFQKISDIYLKYFGSKEISDFETEEVLGQTIFKSFNIEYGLPFTLQNYSNTIIFTVELIKNIVTNKIKIENKKIKNNLLSPHVNENCESIYAIKRIDRNFNEIRNYLSRKGFILNKEVFQLNTYYYSNTSSLYLIDNNHLVFKKNYSIKDDNWFGYELEEGSYNITFDIKILTEIIYYEKIGLKIHYPNEIIYNFFFNDLELNIWKNVTIPIEICEKQKVIFIFDNYLGELNIEFKNIEINPILYENKENISIILYENKVNSNYTINYTNINKMIIEPFSKIYNIYKLVMLSSTLNLNKIANYYNPTHYIIEDLNINDIFLKSTEDIIEFKEKNRIQFKFIIYLRLDSIFKKSVIHSNFYINKFNFISYYIPYINNKICNSYDFISIPYKYISVFYDLINNNKNDINICHLIYANLKDKIEDINFIYDDIYTKNTRTPLIKYLSDLSSLNDIDNNKGYLFNNKYLNNIFYKNRFSKILKSYEDEYYFYKKKTVNPEKYQWIGTYINSFDEKITSKIDIIVQFDIKFLKKINNVDVDFGLKIHEPIEYIKNWIYECELNIYKKIELPIKIYKKNQYIILNFDNYLDNIEFNIKNFKIII